MLTIISALQVHQDQAYIRPGPDEEGAHLSAGDHLLFPLLLQVQLGSAAAAHSGHGGVAFSHIILLLPGRQDLCRGRHLQESQGFRGRQANT